MKFKQTLRRIFRPRDPRRKVLLWATILTLFCGITEIGQPIDMALQIARNAVRSQPVSGDIVIVGIDDKTLEQLGPFPLPNDAHAKVLNALVSMGARSVHYDVYLRHSNDINANRAMENAIINSNINVTLPVGLSKNPKTGIKEQITSASYFRKITNESSITSNQNFFGFVTRLPYEITTNGHNLPSISSKVAHIQEKHTGTYQLDYSYDPKSVQSISFKDIYNGTVESKKILGKTIIVASTAPVIGDIQRYLGHDKVPGAYIHLIGAEHLRRGIPMQAGWLPFAIIAFGIGYYSLRGRNGERRVALAALGFPALFCLGLLLESQSFSVDLFPAFLLLGYALIGRIWIEFGRLRTNTNAVSGHANLMALLEDHADNIDSVLAVAVIRNFDQIGSIVPPEEEPKLVEQIIRRLELGAAGAKIYQTDQGTFAWVVARHAESTIDDQLVALHTVFISPIEMGGRKIDLNVSFGLDADRGRGFSNRVASARLAAERAAHAGKPWLYSDAANTIDTDWNLSILGQLDQAIDNGQLWVAYQPQIDLKTNRITSAEALVRWSHPLKGDIRPDEFILVAERHNRIGKLTSFVLDKSLAALAALNTQGKAPFRIGVNISARMFDDHNFAADVLAQLKQHKVPPACLVLELTESAALSDNGVARQMLDQLRAIGIGISLDDYGTGNSTLGYLRDVPANEIKIDRRFISNVAAGGSDRLLVGSTIELAHSLGMTVVAEGVENDAILDTLRAMGCDMAQGFLIGQPVAFDALSTRIGDDTKRAVA
jgi:diguanylate cyclase